MIPPRLAPMLAGGTGVPRDPGNWQMEPKFDGQRIMATVAGGATSLANRRGADATATYPELAGLAGVLAGAGAVLDGEVVAPDGRGHPSFQRLQRRMHVLQPPPRLLAEVPVVYAVFDLLWLDGELLVDRPQTERRRLLETLGLRGPAWQTAPLLDASPEELLLACRDVGLEGFVAYPSSRGGHRARRQRVGQWSIRALRVGSPYIGPACRSSSWTSPRPPVCARRPVWVRGRRPARRPCGSASATAGRSSWGAMGAMTTG